jgi:hypothetical protein
MGMIEGLRHAADVAEAWAATNRHAGDEAGARALEALAAALKADADREPTRRVCQSCIRINRKRKD